MLSEPSIFIMFQNRWIIKIVEKLFFHCQKQIARIFACILITDSSSQYIRKAGSYFCCSSEPCCFPSHSSFLLIHLLCPLFVSPLWCLDLLLSLLLYCNNCKSLGYPEVLNKQTKKIARYSKFLLIFLWSFLHIWKALLGIYWGKIVISNFCHHFSMFTWKTAAMLDSGK